MFLRNNFSDESNMSDPLENGMIYDAAAALPSRRARFREKLRGGGPGGKDSIINDLSDPNSELSCFLTPDGPSLNTNKAWFYSLALEPQTLRRERIIQLAEAYALFAALFLNGTWFIYEYGSAGKARSLSDGDVTPGEERFYNAWGKRVFDLFVAISIIANVFLAVFSGFLWLLSVSFSGSHRNWVYGARHLLVVCHNLITAVFLSTVVTVALSVWGNLRDTVPELCIAIAYLGAVVLIGMYRFSMLVGTEIPLEYKHMPFWFRLFFLPWPLCRRRGHERMQQGSKIRAEELKARAFRERTLVDLNEATSLGRQSSIGVLLRLAANDCGKESFDIGPFASALDRDWFTDVDQLRSLDVDTLAQYMPRRLAIEVERKLSKEEDFNVSRERSRLSALSAYASSANEDD